MVVFMRVSLDSPNDYKSNFLAKLSSFLNNFPVNCEIVQMAEREVLGSESTHGG